MRDHPKTYGDLVDYDNMTPEERRAYNLSVPVKVGDVIDWVDDYHNLRKQQRVVSVKNNLVMVDGGVRGELSLIRAQIVPPAKPTVESVVENLLSG